MVTTDIRVTTPEDQHLPTFDYTKLTAINACPTWGLVRYDQHKTTHSMGRAMALEAGDACHQAFAAIRYADLLNFGHKWFGPLYDREFVLAHGRKLFSPDRFDEMLADMERDTDPQRQAMLVGLSALHSSGFYDDPDDKRRTLNNLEACLIAYADYYRLDYRLPIYSPKTDIIGIELPIDVVLSFEDGIQVRYIGRADGVSYHSFDDRDTLRVNENKTASRLGTAWETSFELSHQVTGYCMAISVILREKGVLPADSFVNKASIFGLAIPLPKYTTDYNGVVHIPVTRRLDQFADWIKWVEHTVQIWARYRETPLDAPKYTHSCNRYFRPCPLVPLCALPPEDREELWGTLVHDEWSPLKEGADD